MPEVEDIQGKKKRSCTIRFLTDGNQQMDALSSAFQIYTNSSLDSDSVLFDPLSNSGIKLIKAALVLF